MSIRKIFNYKSDILIDLTIEKEGYHPDRYKPKSAKWIWATCRYCGEPTRIRKQFYTQADNSACHKECRIKEQSSFPSPFADKNVQQKAQKSIEKKYGNKVVSKNREIAQKISSSKLRPRNNKNKWIAEITDILIQKGIEYSTNEDLADIVIPDHRLAISLNTTEDVREKDIDKSRRNVQISKSKKASEQGLFLFHIFEHSWQERKDQILNFVKTLVNTNKVKVAARKCELNHDECKDFLNNNHIQGYGNGTIRYFNLEYQSNIVATMTASKHHRQNGGKNNVVLNRLCFADGYNVQGGASKLFKYFRLWAKEEGYDEILSWSDNCWTEGNIYRVLGFELDKEYGPDYFYYDTINRCYRSKQSQRKAATNCPKGMTEKEWCIERGLWRIWDCGKKKWTLKL